MRANERKIANQKDSISRKPPQEEDEQQQQSKSETDQRRNPLGNCKLVDQRGCILAGMRVKVQRLAVARYPFPDAVSSLKNRPSDLPYFFRVFWTEIC